MPPNIAKWLALCVVFRPYIPISVQKPAILSQSLQMNARQTTTVSFNFHINSFTQ
jgi:hypothetical protein